MWAYSFLSLENLVTGSLRDDSDTPIQWLQNCLIRQMPVGCQPACPARAQGCGSPLNESLPQGLVLDSTLMEGRVHHDEIKPGKARNGPHIRPEKFNPGVFDIPPRHIDGAPVHIDEREMGNFRRGEHCARQHADTAAKIGAPPAEYRQVFE